MSVADLYVQLLVAGDRFDQVCAAAADRRDEELAELHAASARLAVVEGQLADLAPQGDVADAPPTVATCPAAVLASQTAALSEDFERFLAAYRSLDAARLKEEMYRRDDVVSEVVAQLVRASRPRSFFLVRHFAVIVASLVIVAATHVLLPPAQELLLVPVMTFVPAALSTLFAFFWLRWCRDPMVVPQVPVDRGALRAEVMGAYRRGDDAAKLAARLQPRPKPEVRLSDSGWWFRLFVPISSVPCFFGLATLAASRGSDPSLVRAILYVAASTGFVTPLLLGALWLVSLSGLLREERLSEFSWRDLLP